MVSNVDTPEFTKKLDFNLEIQKLVSNIGWDLSIKSSLVVDEKGNPIPWYNYSMVHFLKERLSSEMKICEYGSGFSTLFFANIVEQVYSLESKESCYLWLKKILDQNNIRNIDIRLVLSNLPKSIKTFNNLFDIIIIDSRDRVECLNEAVNYLSSNGVILFDNSEREKYHCIFDKMTGNGFKYINFYGIKPLSSDSSQSTIFYRKDNCFNI